MASSAPTEHRPVSWLNYFFLYDGSKVRGEGDPTRAGINYFYPPQTILDQQELLCGQIAGVVRCMTEVANSSPNLIRLRKLKFAIVVDGDYLWALGCSVDVTDVSCKHFLQELIGLFLFYNGPLQYAYEVRSQAELDSEWNLYIEFIQNTTTDLHRIFNSLSHLDKTKVDPLLLLKAALILQTCQRFPNILAGCILYKNHIVSTQLPPSLTSKILIQRVDLVQSPSSENSRDVALPQDVYMIPVFVMENEITSLRHYPAQWMTRMPTPSKTLSSFSPSHSKKTSGNQFLVSEDSTQEGTTGSGELSPVHLPTEEAPLQGIGKTISQEIEDNNNRERLSTGSFATCDSMMDFENKEDGLETFEDYVPVSQKDNSSTVTNEDQTYSCEQSILLEKPENRNDQQDNPEYSTNDGTLEKSSPSSQTTDINFSPKGSNVSDWSLLVDSTPSSNSTQLVQLMLYVHNVKGLVLALLAECPLQHDKASVQDVYDSTLASLNGLEVHLKETLPVNNNNLTKSTYSFTHYDPIQHILTANLPSVSSTHDRHFLRAASLIHSDFNQHQSFQEITVRNASSAIYGCQSAVHETYFQQLAPPIRNSGVPDPQDSAFFLSSKAKQKLLKHGLNLL
ncbi:Hermansky-Pudlak syndrome 4 protein [Xenopus tropicalis]|uniref:Hermansky-Pudlak syndrome 4 n=1 Tax=Xenopus tropicalis TaxID=8364 RepID=Q0P4V6_XENTR|eukprot:NP_001072472.1 Hermansky-Pudlak syndrome 4 protein [Xenopus tropicalis]